MRKRHGLRVKAWDAYAAGVRRRRGARRLVAVRAVDVEHDRNDANARGEPGAVRVEDLYDTDMDDLWQARSLEVDGPVHPEGWGSRLGLPAGNNVGKSLTSTYQQREIC